MGAFPLCHPEGVMENEIPAPARQLQFGQLLLAIDTCGPTGSVALGRLAGRDLEILGQTELEGRSYSTTLIAAVGDLLKSAGVVLGDLGGIVAVKGLAEGAGIAVVAISRLEVLSRKTGVPSAALDAHRGEVFLRLEGIGRAPRELLAGAHELAAIAPPPLRVAVCDDAAAALLASAWPGAQLVMSPPPMAKDTLRIGEARLVAGAAVDLALLDAHYLRRSDAEIFGEAAGAPRS